MRVGMALLVTTSLGLPRAALADPQRPSKSQCFDSYEQAQRLRKATQLRASREQLLVCASDACPGFVKQDCARWLAEVEASIPTIVLVGRGPDGSALVDVHVTMDGQPLADRADGRAIPVDPGVHQMRYESGGRRLDAQVIVVEGAKNQEVVADFSSAPASPAKEGPAAPVETPAARDEAPAPAHSKIPTATWALGGVAVAGLASFAVFASMGRSVQACAPRCAKSQVNSLRADYLAADVSWVLALAAAGGAVYFALRPPVPAGGATSWSASATILF